MEVECNKIKKKYMVEFFIVDIKVIIDWNVLFKMVFLLGLSIVGFYWYLFMGVLLSFLGCNNCWLLLYIVDGKMLV